LSRKYVDSIILITAICIALIEFIEFVSAFADGGDIRCAQ